MSGINKYRTLNIDHLPKEIPQTLDENFAHLRRLITDPDLRGFRTAKRMGLPEDVLNFVYGHDSMETDLYRGVQIGKYGTIDFGKLKEGDATEKAKAKLHINELEKQVSDTREVTPGGLAATTGTFNRVLKAYKEDHPSFTGKEPWKSWTNDGQMAAMELDDNGLPIDPKELEHIDKISTQLREMKIGMLRGQISALKGLVNAE